MSKTNRLPRAPSTPLPELINFLQPFQDLFHRRENRTALERYLTGLLTDHPHKNCDTLASVVPGTSEQQLQGLLTSMQWDADALNQQRAEQLRQLPTEGDAVLIFDDTGFLMQGRASVGVARQYSGTIGKVANCQVTVNCHYAERTVAWPIASSLYLSEDWCADATRRTKAHIPDDVQFQTKPGIALTLLDQACEWGIPHACVPADAPVIIGLDDHIERRRGEKVAAKGIYRDGVRSSKSFFVKTSGLRWVSMMLLAPREWAKRVWALPFLSVLAPSERYHHQRGQRHKTLPDWARQSATRGYAH
jgi:hypothetical protein